jgi:hypothetical protein
MLAVFAGGPAMADSAKGPDQAQQNQGQQPKGDPGLQSKSDEELHRDLAAEKDPARQQAIRQELSRRISDGFAWENLPDDPYTGGSLDIPLGDWAGVTIGGGINSQWGMNFGGGAYAGTPHGPSVGKVSPRPDGLNAAVDLDIPLGNGSLKLKGSLNLNTLNGSATGSLSSETTPGRTTEEGVTVTFTDGKMEVTKKDGTKVDLGEGASLSLDQLNVDQNGKVDGGGTLNLPGADKDKDKGPWGKRPPSVSLRGQLTYDKSYRTLRELLEGLGILSRPSLPTPAEVEEAKKRWAEAQNQRHKQQNKPVQSPQPAPSKPATPPQPPTSAQPPAAAQSPAQAPVSGPPVVQEPPVVLAPPHTPPAATPPAPPESQPPAASPPTTGQDPARDGFGGQSSDHDPNSGSTPPDNSPAVDAPSGTNDSAGSTAPDAGSPANQDASPPDAGVAHQNNTSNQDTTDPGGSDPSASDPGRMDPEASDPGASDSGTGSAANQDASPPDAGAAHQNNTSNQDTTDPGGSDPGASAPGDDGGWGGCACF